ncbi:MAG: winged helix-turn-helix domain-containing protein [Myxococcota bacterium]
MIAFRGCRIDLITREIEQDGQATHRLTGQEAKLLTRLAATPGQPVSRDTLLREVWGFSSAVASRAPDVAVRRLRLKIEIDPSHPQRIITVPGEGWAVHGLLEPMAHPGSPQLFGRQPLLEAVAAALRDGSVVLVGPPGIGKTALAEAALAHAPFGVVQPPLQDLSDEDQLRCALRAAWEQAGNDDVVWLDAPEGIARELASVLRRRRRRILVTSRQVVDVPDAFRCVVPPLDAKSGRALFLHRAPSVTREALDATMLLQRCGGVPLVIELAAARAQSIGPEALDQGGTLWFERLLGPHNRRTLFTRIRRSWDLLEPATQEVLIAMTPFIRGFDLATAEAVSPATRVWPGDALAEAADASMLEVTLEGGRAQYRWPAIVRWFITTQGAPPLDRLLRWINGGGEAAPETLIALLDRIRNTDLPDSEISHQHRVALTLAIDDRIGPQLTAAQRLALLDDVELLADPAVARRRGMLRWRRGDRTAGQTLDTMSISANSDLQARLRIDAARMRRERQAVSSVDIDALDQIATEGRSDTLRLAALIELCQQQDAIGARSAARVTLRRAELLDSSERHISILSIIRAQLALSEMRLEDSQRDALRATTIATNNIEAEQAWRIVGGSRYASGDLAGAVTAWERALQLARRVGLSWHAATVLGNLGSVYGEMGALDTACATLEEALACNKQFGQPRTEAILTINLGRVFLLRGDVKQARPLLEAGRRLSSNRGWQQYALHSRLNLAIADQLQRREGVHEALRELVSDAVRLEALPIAAWAAAHLIITHPDEGRTLLNRPPLADRDPLQVRATLSALLMHDFIEPSKMGSSAQLLSAAFRSYHASMSL